MKYFQGKKKKENFLKLGISVVIFVIVILCFIYSLQGISQMTVEEQQQSLLTSIKRSVVHCYAVEGQYPESLQYIEEHYGIDYNKESFIVDYQVVAANIMPDITVIVKNR